MSRAFVKETENDTVELPDRPISPHRNLVTGTGLAAIKVTLSRFEAAHRAATDKGDREAVAAASREIRYWGARLASAEVVKLPADKSKASFGMTVTLRRDDGREQSFKIVGEDEADPSCGTVSHASPRARAVLSHGPGEAVMITGREALILDVRKFTTGHGWSAPTEQHRLSHVDASAVKRPSTSPSSARMEYETRP